jgi:RHS repeat-associated protein
MLFQAATDANGQATFSFQVQDDGGTTNGGVDSLTESLTITVTAVNDAPVLDSGATYTLAGILEDATDNGGTLVSSLLGSNVSDIDGNTCGIALTGVDTDNGVWQYSSDNGSIWNNISGVSETAALLLGAGARIRFVPNADWNGDLASAITFRAWDQSSGTVGDKVDTSVNGGTTAFSSEVVSASISVAAVNDAPSIATVSDQTTSEDQTLTFTITVGDAETSAGDLTVTATSSNGTLVPAENISFEMVEGEDDQWLVQLTPASDASGQATITLTVSDGELSSSTSFALTVTPANDAPVLNSGATYTLTGILEDPTDNDGTLVSTLLGDNVSDIDGNTCGVALTGIDTDNGMWQYSSDNGSSWNDITSVSETAALLLAAYARIRFVPNADWNGDLTSAISFRAWDQSSGTAGGSADTTVNGGTTAFSSEVVSASISVTAVNDAPSFTKGADVRVSQEDGAQTISGWATDISAGALNEAGQTLTFVVSTNNDSLFETLPTISATGTLTFTPASDVTGTATISVYLVDGDGTEEYQAASSAVQTFTITVTSRVAITSVSTVTVEGTPITVTGAITDEVESDVTYAWTVYKDDNEEEPFATSGSGTTTSFVFTPDDNGSYRVVFSITDSSGTSSTSTTINVANVAPTAAFEASTLWMVEQPIEVSGKATDPAGTNDTLSYSWAVFKTGSDTAFATASNIDTFTFTPDALGDYTIKCIVTDEDKDSSTAEQTVSVTDVTTIRWTGAGSNNLWTTAANWSVVGGGASRVPTAYDNVVIDVSANPTIIVSGGSAITVNTLKCTENLTILCGLTVNNLAVFEGSTTVSSGSLELKGAWRNTGSMIVSDGTSLTLGNGTATSPACGTLTGTITLQGDADLSTHGTQSLTGTGRIAISSDGELLVNDGALTVGKDITIHGAGGIRANALLINQGTITADTTDATLLVRGSVSNLGIISAKGSSILWLQDTKIRGGEVTISDSEAFLSWKGLDLSDEEETIVVEGSLDGIDYYQLAEVTETGGTYLVCNLERNTAYYLRAVVSDSTGGKVIYDGGRVITADTAPTSGWYQIASLTKTSDGSTLTPSEVGITDASWVSAGSELGAFLKIISNNHLVFDGSVPTIQSGAVTTWILNRHDAFYGLTFDTSRYYNGAYSEPVPGSSIVPKVDTGTGTNNSDAFGGDPIRYFDGAVDYSVTDIESGESTSSLSLSRSWTSDSTWSTGQSIGNGWIDNAMPVIMQGTEEGTIYVIYSAMDIVTFVLNDDNEYIPTSYTADTLVHDESDNLFTLSDCSGNQYSYNDFSAGVLAGKFASKRDAYGLLTAAAYTDGVLTDLCRYNVDGTPVEKLAYTYDSSGRRHTVVLSRLQGDGLVDVQTVTYTYYTGTYVDDDQFGNKGDLKTVVTTNVAGDILSQYYYRYTLQTASFVSVIHPIDNRWNTLVGSYGGGLEYVFDTQALACLAAAVADPYIASNAEVASYALHYFKYDQERRVVTHSVQGVGTFTYTYSSNGQYSDDANTWVCKTAEKTPDGSVNVVYCNNAGDVILKVTYDNDELNHEEAIKYYQYNTLEQVVLKAEGEAIASYNESNANLTVSLSTDSGAIYTYTYGTDDSATEASAGDVEGYLKTISVQEGEGTGVTVVLLESRDYYVKTTDDGHQIILLASDVVYSGTATSPTQTTDYRYTSWYAGTVGVHTMTTTLPAVTVNGTTTRPVYEYTYDANGRLIEMTDAKDVVITYTYDSVGNVTTIVQNDVDTPSNAATEDVTTTYTYDSLGRVTRMTDAEGYITYYVYNDATREIRTYAGWNSTTHNTTGAITVYREDLTGNYTETLTYSWTGNGLAVNADGSPTGTESLTSSYAELKSLSRSLMNSSGRVYAVREYFNLTGLTYCTARDLGTKYAGDTSTANYYETRYEYGAWGDLVKVTDAKGVVTTYEHNALGQVTKVCQNWHDPSDGANQNIITTYEYDINGNLTSKTDASGVKTLYSYNYLNQQIEVCQNCKNGSHSTADQDVITNYTYDLLGNVLTVTDALGNTTTYAYNAFGKVASKTDDLGNLTTYAYDILGNLLSVTDGEGHTTSYAYDALGRQTSTSDGNNDTTTYTYDAVGNLLTVKDAEESTTTYTYDALGRVTTETDQLGNEKSYEYDAIGNLAKSTDAKDHVIKYEYDALGRETAEKWLDSLGNVIYSISYAYDALGELSSATASNPQSPIPDSSYTYTYDALGHVNTTTEVLAGLSAIVVLTYQYDQVGNVTQVAATIGGTADYVIDYTYDALGRVTSIRQHAVDGENTVAEKRIDLTYDVLGQYATITTYADLAGTKLVATATYEFNDAYELVGLKYEKGSTTLASYTYTYDDAGNIHSMAIKDGTTTSTYTYTYDGAGQLISADSAGTEDDESYTYDENGNRVTANGDAYGTGDDNQLTSDGSYKYTYDAEGNRIAKFVDTNNDDALDADDTDITTYTWDYRNRLTEVEHFAAYANFSADTSDQIVQYTYDAFNRLIGRTLDSDGSAGTGDLQEAVYVYDGDQVALQFDKTVANGSTAALSASDLSHRYLWNSQAVDQLFADENVADDEVLYALTDHEGTIRDLVTYDAVNDVSTVANHRVYDSYGNLTSETANAAVDCLFGYTGRQYDEATGLQNNLNRWYDPAVGRWVSEDPIGFAGGDANLSRYCGNGPTNWVDPSGTKGATVVTDATTEQDPYDWQFRRDDSRLFLNVKSTDEMLSLLEKEFGPGELTGLNISGHGSSAAHGGGIQFAKSPWFANSNLTDEQVCRLKRLLANGAAVSLYGCNTAGSGAQKLANRLGRTVWGTADSCSGNDIIMPGVLEDYYRWAVGLPGPYWNKYTPK